MNTKDLTAFCKFYKGEKAPKYEGDELMLWTYERDWVIHMSTVNQNEADDAILSTYLSEYLAAGLEDLEPDNGQPITLKAFLFNGYAKKAQAKITAAPSFKKLLRRYYHKQQ